MLKKMLDFGIVKIIPFKETFYKKFDTPKKLKLTPHLLELNYAHYAPFSKPYIIHYNDKKTVHLWFSQKTINAPFVIPESYLIFRALQKEHNNAIVVVQSEITKIFVIKNGILEDLFNMNTFDEQTLALSKQEHHIQNHTIISQSEYVALQQKAISDFPLLELWRWNQLHLNPKDLLQKSINSLTYPLSALIVLYIGMNAYHNHQLENDLTQLEQDYLALKNKNSDIHAQSKAEQKRQKALKTFIGNELLYPDTMLILHEIFSTLSTDKKQTIQLVNIAGSKLTIEIQTDQSPVIFLNHLNAISLFSDVTITNTYKRRNKKKTIRYEAYIKPLKVQQ